MCDSMSTRTASSALPTVTPLSANALFNAKGIVAVITGGGTGIGLMMAKALEANGARVYIVGRRLDVLETAARVHARHSNIIPLAADVTSKSQLAELAEQIAARESYINVLINNAGILGQPLPPGVFPRPPPFNADSKERAGQTQLADVQSALWAQDVDDWATTLTVNVAGPYFTSVAFLELLAAGVGTIPQGPQVVFVSSIAGQHRMLLANFQYNASKAAVAHLAKMWATNFAQFGIRANAIAPGIYPSEMTAGPGNQKDGVSSLEGKVYPAGEIPLRRPGTEAEMAAAILGLIGPGGSYLNGTVVVTDGGRLGVFPGTY